MIIYEASIQYRRKGEIPNAMALKTAQDVCNYLRPMVEESPMQESFYVIALNRKNFPLGVHRATTGTASSCLVHPREVFRFAIMEGASAIICAHNHPSGDPSPSNADIQITRQLRDASRAVGIELLDHVIVGDKTIDPTGISTGYYSFRDAGLL